MIKLDSKCTVTVLIEDNYYMKKPIQLVNLESNRKHNMSGSVK